MARQTPPDGAAEGEHRDPSGLPHALAYRPALDGVRALAVALVIAFHFGVPHSHGGFLGVDVFFGLSGYLITTLLLQQSRGSGRPLSARDLGRFWGRRLKRLAPALLVLVVVVTVVSAILNPPGYYPSLRADALSALLYVANWHFMVTSSNYFSQMVAPSILTHTWSLAIEEQFYLVWPLIIGGLTRLVGRARSYGVIVVGVVGALLSTLDGAMIVGHHLHTNRLYYGTDTHLQSIMLGAAAAGLWALWSSAPRVNEHPARRPFGTALASVGALGLALLVWRTSGSSPWLFRGGLLAVGLCVALLVLGVQIHDRSVLARALSWRPLAYLGRLSYGLYLWHYPLLAWLTAARTGLSGWSLFALRLLVTWLLAEASFRLVESPLRRRTWSWRRALPTFVTALTGAVVVAVLAGGAAETLPTVALPAWVTPPHPVSVLVIGDSQVLTLELAIDSYAGHAGVVTHSAATLGCGVVGFTRAIGRGVSSRNKECLVARDGTFLAQQIRARAIASLRPQVVLIAAGRWETHDLLIHGRHVDITQAALRRRIRQSLRELAFAAHAVGARVAFLTTPCSDSGESPWGRPWPEDSASRLGRYNHLIEQLAPHLSASVFDLNALVCPHGRFTTYLEGRMIRDADGVHFARGVGPLVGARLMTWLHHVGVTAPNYVKP